MDKRKFISNTILNVVGSIIPILILQFIILPAISPNFDEEYWGLIITYMGLFNIAKSLFGNTINNSRLLRNKLYEEKKLIGDYNIYFFISLGCNLIFMFIMGWLYAGEFNFYNLLLLIVISLFTTAVEYLSVSYRINLQYLRMFLSNIALVGGYFIGYLLFKLTNLWQLIFLFGAFFNFIFVVFSTKIVREKFCFTVLSKQTLYSILFLTLGAAISVSISYFDRLFIYPMLGGASTSIYYTATLIGKSAGLALGPISAVILSYLVRINKLKIKFFLILNSILFVACIPGFFIFFYTSKFLLPIMYPQQYSEVEAYLAVCCLIAIFETIRMFNSSFLLRYSKMSVFLTIQSINLVLNVVLGIVLSIKYLLFGYCYAVLISTIIGAILTVLMTVFSLRKNSIQITAQNEE